VAWVIRAVTRAPVAHAFLATGNGTQIIEGDPRGARYSDATRYRDVTWLTHLSEGLTDAQRAEAVQWAVAHLGTPYSWLDDAYIGFQRLFGWAPKWMQSILSSDHTLMCSQLCCAAYRSVGVDLFPGRPDGAESPGDLWRLNNK
jgi:uncharacterized protein YycO